MPRFTRSPSRAKSNQANCAVRNRRSSGRRNTWQQVHGWLDIHRPMIDNMLNGFILYEVMRDDAGDPIDYVFRYVNSASEKLTHMSASDVLAKRATEVFPSFDRHRWHAVYRQVVLSGEPGTLTEYHPAIGAFVELNVYSPLENFLAVTFTDVSERVQAERGLRERLRVEHALAEVSSLLLSKEEADITGVLGILGRAVNANRAYIFLFKDDHRYMDNTHEWCAPGTRPEIDNLQACPTEDALWWMEQIKANKIIVIPDISAMPAEAAAEKQVLQAQDIQSLLAVPMCSEGEAVGYLGFDDTTGPRQWSQEEEYLLRAASDLVTGYFEHCRVLDALRNSEARYHELTELLPQAVFEMNNDGLLTFVNQFALDQFGYTREDYSKGVNVLQTVIPEQRERVITNIRRLLNDDQHTKGNEYTAIRKDGSTFPVIIYSDKVIRNGAVVGVRGVIVDVTEQKQVEEELRGRTSELEAIVNAFPDLYFWLDSAGVILDYHTTCTSDLYTEPSDFLGRRFGDVLPRDAARRLESAIAEVAESKSQRTVEYCLDMEPGRQYFEARLTPLNPDRVLGIIRNITSRKQAEEALRDSERKFRSVFDASLDGFVILDEYRRIVDVNHRVCDLIGLPEDEIIGRDAWDFVDPDQDLDGLWDSFIREGVRCGELTVHCSDGARRYVEYRAVTHALPGYHFASLSDITDRKAVERSYASLVHSIPGIVYRVSVNKVPAIEFISKDTVDLLGWTKEEVAAMSIADLLDMVAPEDHQAVDESIFSNTDGDIYHLHLDAKSRDGDVRRIETMGCLHRGRDGAVETVEGIVFDVTERVREQEQLNRVRRMETVGKLAAGIAHDFNNLLQAILGYTRVLQENTSLDQSARQDLREIERVSLRAADLVRQILAFSRQTPGNVEPVDIAAVVDEAVQLIKTTFPKDIDIVTVVPARLPSAMADPSQIHEVLVNLCLNARDAMPDGGKLVISLEQVAVTKKFINANPWARTGKFLRCVVSDNGQGMSEETLKRAFDPFFTTKPLHKGTGLGLSTCYGIVENHGGFMNLDSTLGGGTSVSVFLPAAEKTIKQNPTPELVFDARGSETVLVVDDEEYIRRLTERLLCNLGYSVIQAEDGARALEAIESARGKIDIVLLDLHMPGLSGVAALEAMRRTNPDLKVLVLSGMDTELDLLPDDVRPDGVLQKPCQPEALLKAVREVLDRQESRA